MVKLVLAHLEKEPTPLDRLRADVSPQLSAVVARMLAKDPAQRFQTPLEAAQTLGLFCRADSRPASAPVVELPRMSPSAEPVATSQTVAPGETSRMEPIPVPGTPRAPRKTALPAQPGKAPSAGPDESPFEEMAEAPEPTKSRRRKGQSSRSPVVWLVGLAGLLLVVGLILWASGVLGGKPRTGTTTQQTGQPTSPPDGGGSPGKPASRPGQPAPLMEWDFPNGVPSGTRLVGGAKRDRTGLVLAGNKAQAITEGFSTPLREKTLEVWLKPASLEQPGTAMAVETLDGKVFDSLLFGEKQPAHWMAGSEFFNRYRPFGGPAETGRRSETVHLALVFQANGTISAYRNGKPYGQPYTPGPLVEFQPGLYRVVFGPGLSATIVHARLHKGALKFE